MKLTVYCNLQDCETDYYCKQGEVILNIESWDVATWACQFTDGTESNMRMEKFDMPDNLMSELDFNRTSLVAVRLFIERYNSGFVPLYSLLT